MHYCVTLSFLLCLHSNQVFFMRDRPTVDWLLITLLILAFMLMVVDFQCQKKRNQFRKKQIMILHRN